MGWESASTLPMMGSSISSGRKRRARDLVPHLGRRRVRIALQVELDVDQAALGAAARGHHVHAFDAGQLVFQRLGHLGLDHLGRGALVGSVHRHDGLVDLGVLAHRETGIRDQADQHDDQRQDRCEHRPLDAVSEMRMADRLEEWLGSAPQAPSPTIWTGAPSVTRCRPATTSWSPSPTPVRISTRPSRRSPMVTARRSATPSRTRYTYCA